MLTWSSINYHVPTSKSDILKQVLWFNSNIKDRNNTLFLNSWYKKGIILVEHIFKESNFKTCQFLQTEFGSCINIIDYYRVIEALPKEWLKIVKSNIQTGSDIVGIELVKNNPKCSKIVYDYLTDKISKDENTYNRHKWELDLNYEISDCRWRNLYQETM